MGVESKSGMFELAKRVYDWRPAYGKPGGRPSEMQFRLFFNYPMRTATEWAFHTRMYQSNLIRSCGENPITFWEWIRRYQYLPFDKWYEEEPEPILEKHKKIQFNVKTVAEEFIQQVIHQIEVDVSKFNQTESVGGKQFKHVSDEEFETFLETLMDAKQAIMEKVQEGGEEDEIDAKDIGFEMIRLINEMLRFGVEDEDPQKVTFRRTILLLKAKYIAISQTIALDFRKIQDKNAFIARANQKAKADYAQFHLEWKAKRDAHEIALKKRYHLEDILDVWFSEKEFEHPFHPENFTWTKKEQIQIDIYKQNPECFDDTVDGLELTSYGALDRFFAFSADGPRPVDVFMEKVSDKDFVLEPPHSDKTFNDALNKCCKLFGLRRENFDRGQSFQLYDDLDIAQKFFSDITRFYKRESTDTQEIKDEKIDEATEICQRQVDVSLKNREIRERNIEVIRHLSKWKRIESIQQLD